MNTSNTKLLRDMAMLDFEEGNLPVAESKLTELLNTISEVGTPFAKNELCQCLINRSIVYQHANRWEDALKDLDTCEGIALNLKGLPRGAILHNVYHSRTKIFTRPHTPVHDLEKAHAALNEFRNYSFQDWMADELEGDIEYRKKNWQKAANLYRSAAKALETQQWLRAGATCRLRTGLSLIELAEWHAARIEIEAACKFFKEFGPPDQLIAVQMARARILSADGQHDDAWKVANWAIQGIEGLIRLFRNLYEQQRFILDKVRYYHQAFEVGLRKGDQEGIWRAWTMAERAKSFYLCQLMANSDVQLFDGVDAADVERLKKIDEQIDHLESHHDRLKHIASDTNVQMELSKQLQDILNEKRILLGKIMRSNPHWAALKTPIPFQPDVELKKIDPTWLPLSYFFHPKDDGAILYIFFAGTNQVPHCITKELSTEELETLRQCRDNLRGKLPAYLPQFYPDKLVEKVLPTELLKSFHPGQKLLVSPHDLLQAIPLHAIENKEGIRLIDQNPVQYIPTLALLPLQRQNKLTKSEEVFLIGCEQDNFQDPQLKEVREEIQKLEELWKAKRPGMVRSGIVEQENSPAEIGLPLEKWGDAEFLHIACHGVFPEDRPLDAAFRLGKDAIRASEFFRVRLSAKLVSLSACALGRQTRREASIDLRGDEWLGLYLPLFYTGAQVLLVSLWDANSQITVPFMSALHGKLSDNASPELAFQYAQHQVKSKPLPFWANWYLVGFPQ